LQFNPSRKEKIVLTLINGDGAGLRPAHHFNDVLVTTTRLIQYVEKGQLEVAHLLAANFTPLERCVVSRLMINRGIAPQTVLRTLS